MKQSITYGELLVYHQWEVNMKFGKMHVSEVKYSDGSFDQRLPVDKQMTVFSVNVDSGTDYLYDSDLVNSYKILNHGSEDIEVIVLPNENVKVAIGGSVILRNGGTGKVHVNGFTGVTVISSHSSILEGLYSTAILTKVAHEVWELDDYR